MIYFHYLNPKVAFRKARSSSALLYYVEYHDDRVSEKVKHANMVSFDDFQKLMLLQVADAKAHVMIPVVLERIKVCTALAGEKGRELWEEIGD